MTSGPPSYPHIGRKTEGLDAAYWENRYRRHDTGWDQGGSSPGLVDFLKEQRIEGRSVLVPGCGRGHDARALSRAGCEVVGIDLARSAVREAARLARSESLPARFVRGDYFTLSAALAGPYDWIFEHTFFCAVDPDLRDAYVHRAAQYLNSEGLLLGVFFQIHSETGPPFGTTRQELIERFSPRFSLRLEGIPRSYPEREDKELLMLWQRRRDV